MPRPLFATLALAAVVFLSAAPAAAGGQGAARHATWRAPVVGLVAHLFAYSVRVPFARGARRGVDLDARRGEPVLAPCSGTITFAGRVPRFGGALALRCGRLVATLLRVRAVAHGRVRQGARIGRAEGEVRLGARVAGQRFGYIDPLELLGENRPRHTPLGRAPRSRSPLALPEPRRAPQWARSAPVPRASLVAAPAPGRLPWTAWAGLAALAAGLPAGTLVRRRRAVVRHREPATGHR